jgi:hypothetical protein
LTLARDIDDRDAAGQHGLADVQIVVIGEESRNVEPHGAVQEIVLGADFIAGDLFRTVFQRVGRIGGIGRVAEVVEPARIEPLEKLA